MYSPVFAFTIIYKTLASLKLGNIQFLGKERGGSASVLIFKWDLVMC